MPETIKGLVDQYGRPLRKAELKREIAGPTLTGVRSVITGYPGDGLNPVRLANILREADQGDPLRYFELAETVEERDLHYTGVLGTRKRSVAQLDIIVDTASDSPEHVRQAEMVRTWIDRDELGDEIFDMLDAIGKGISMTEIIWDTSEGQWRPDRLEWRDPRWFTFDRADGRTPLLRSDEGDQPLPSFKFIQTIIRAKSGLPVRSGIARLATWSWMFKAFTMRDWAIFVQTFGQPIRVGRYGANASEDDKDTLYRAVANIAGDCAAIIPETMNIEFIQAQATNSHSDLYRERADWLDQQVSKAVLGQTTTTDAISGGHAVSQEHRQVQEDIERADARALSGILNRDLIRPWIDLEFGPQDSYPRLRIGRRDEQDLEIVIKAVEKLVPLGMQVAKSDMNEMLGLPVPDEGAELLESAQITNSVNMAPGGTQRTTGDQMGAQPARRLGVNKKNSRRAGNNETKAAQAQETIRPHPLLDGIDELTVAADDLASGASDRQIDRLRDLLDQVETLEEFRDRLLEIDPHMEAPDLAEAMRLALVYAEMSGRSGIVNPDA
jgi:phage gp29-like protein